MEIALNDVHQRLVKEILAQLDALQLDDGSFMYSSFEPGSGPFQTLESLVPFLLVPFSDDYRLTIFKGITYCLDSQQEDGGFRPYPEYRYWNHSAVDSTALALYVFCLARNRFPQTIYHELVSSLEQSRIASRIDAAVARILRFLETQLNDDGGWGFVRRPGFFSRTYSTALVVNGVSYCSSKDFGRSGIDGLHLLKAGTEYLTHAQNQDPASECYGAWSFGPDDGKHGPNITAVAVWSLVASLRHNRDVDTQRSIDLGVKHIIRAWKDRNETEIVRVPVSDSRPKDDVRIEEFVHDYYHILPAALLSGEVGYSDDRIYEIARNVESSFRKGLERHRLKPVDPGSALISWDLAANAFALISVFSVSGLLENCTSIFPHLGLLTISIQIIHEYRRTRFMLVSVGGLFVLAICTFVLVSFFGPISRWLSAFGIDLTLVGALVAEFTALILAYAIKRVVKWAKSRSKSL
jgi:hypothetical protein